MANKSLNIRAGWRALVGLGASPYNPVNISGIGSAAAQWRKFQEYQHYENAFETNVGVSSVIDIKASAKANVRFKLKDSKTGVLIPANEMNPEQLNLYNLLKQPNPFQSTYEFWKQFEIFKSVFGNAYWYTTLPEGFTDPLDAYSLVNIWPQYITPIYTGQLWDAKDKSDLIKYYLFQFGKLRKEFDPLSIVHRNDVRITLNPDQLTMGTSRLQSLSRPITNIDKAFESRHVISKNRGALGIFSGGTKDQVTGTMPLSPKNKTEIQEDFKQFGTLEHQWQYIFTRFPLQFQRTAMSVKELMLFEEVAIDIIHIATKFGVPEVLVKAYLEGATFENQEASERRLYQNTIIPETDDDVIALNNYFRTEERGFEIVGSFAHIPVLQKNRVENATVNEKNNKIYMDLFMKGACTLGEWQEIVGANVDPALSDKRIWDLTPEQREIIGLKTTTNEPS
jgi:hypothetical protein